MAFSKTQEFVLPGFFARKSNETSGLKDFDIKTIVSARIVGTERYSCLFLTTVNNDLVGFDLAHIDGYKPIILSDNVAFARALGWAGQIEFLLLDMPKHAFGRARGVIDAQI